MAKPSPEIKQRMERELQVISVLPHATTQADASLLRGASISGTVTYDDGTPTIGLAVSLYLKDAMGLFTENVTVHRFVPPADDHGHFRFDALPPGNYVVAAELSLTAYSVSTMPMATGNGEMHVTMTTPFHLAHLLRQRPAPPRREPD